MQSVHRFRAFGLAMLLTFVAVGPVLGQTAASDLVIQTLSTELQREQSALGKQTVAPYYISYNVGDEQTVSMTASYGSIVKLDSSRRRMLLVDLRVGDYSIDNTHQIRASNYMFARGGARMIPFESAAEALKLALWRETNQAYNSATERLQQVRTNKTVKVAEEDSSGDFSQADASNHYYEAPVEMGS